MLRAVPFAAVVIAVLVWLPSPGRASLYQPDDTRMSIPVDGSGLGQALPFDEFDRRLATLTNALDAQKNPKDRQDIVIRIERRKAARNLSPSETAALAADLLRVGKPDEAVNRLMPLSRSGRPDYFVLTTLAQAHAARGEWREAVNVHFSALEDAAMPAEVKGLTKAQRDWQAKLDRDYVWAYYREHQKEAAVSPRPALEAEDVLPLFPVEQAGKTSPGPVRFVNEAGHYEPGRLAAAEKGKLPPDAVAVVQQLLLWFPTDTRLFWLLGELYAADGDVSSARTIFDKCVNARQYGNRKLLMDHRAAVLAALETRKPPAEPPPPAEDAQPPTEPTAQPVPIGLGAVWIYFGVVAAIVVLAAVRVLVRRGKGNCGPIG